MDAITVDDQEVILHAYAHVGGRASERVMERVQRVWDRCTALLNLTVPIGALRSTVAAGTGTIAVQDQNAICQAFLRRVDDMVNVSVLVSLPKGSWSDHDLVVDRVLDSDEDAFLGICRLYVGTLRDGSPDAGSVPGAHVKGWEVLDGELEVGELEHHGTHPGERRLVVLARPGGEGLLGDWTWAQAEPAMPRLARYLLHTAKIRDQVRVHAGWSEVGPLCGELDDAVAAVAARVPGSWVDLLRRRAAVVDRVHKLRRLRRSVENGESNAVRWLGRAEGAFTADRALAAWFLDRIDDDIHYLRVAEEGAQRVAEIVREASDRGGARAATPPAFGIITALAEEFAAMRVLIDDPVRHVVRGDRTPYYVGTVPSLEPGHPHRVVLALLGETGNNAAADACANLARSFDSVSCVIMTGIAAGIPAPDVPHRHVRLGDIVVGSWGVIDYDHVTDSPDGRVLRQGHPSPSSLLGRCAKLLEADEWSDERPWERWIEHGVARLPDFARPDHGSDLLYATDDTDVVLTHPALRLSRHRQGWPKVHQGTIGSGDRSLRSIAARDAIAAEHGVIALEMEATGVGKAGFSNGLEWFVVRGVSDYGDRRASRLWRRYAALVAAAYTRALLAACPPLDARGGHNGQVDHAGGALVDD